MTYIVNENQSFAQVCARVFSPTDDIEIPATTSFTLSPVTVEGTAGINYT